MYGIVVELSYFVWLEKLKDPSTTKLFTNVVELCTRTMYKVISTREIRIQLK